MYKDRVITLVIGLLCGAAVAAVPLTQKANALQQQIAQLQQQQNALLAQRSELAKRDLPVEIRYREHVLFQTGAQLIIQNVSGSDLPVTAEFTRADSPPMTRELVVPANGFVSVDARQGWAFEPGDSIKLHNPSFRDWYNPSIRW